MGEGEGEERGEGTTALEGIHAWVCDGRRLDHPSTSTPLQPYQGGVGHGSFWFEHICFGGWWVGWVVGGWWLVGGWLVGGWWAILKSTVHSALT